MLIAVYGTLKKGYGNNTLLKKAKFKGEDFVKCYSIDSGGFPKANFNFNNSNGKDYFLLQVELYEVDTETLQLCDRLEGHPNWYKRLPIETESGKECEIYSMPQEFKYNNETIKNSKPNWLELIANNKYNWKHNFYFN